MERYYIVLLDTFLEEMDSLTDEEYGSLVRAGQRYAMTGEISEVRGNAKFYIKRMYNTIDYYTRKMDETSTRRSEAGKMGGRPRKQKKQKVKDIKKEENQEREEKSGVPPSLSEVEAYCQEAGLRVNAALFHSYYQARGWKLNGQPIDDWKATVQTWVLRERGTLASSPEQAVSTAPDAAEVERMRRLREQLQRGKEVDSTTT